MPVAHLRTYTINKGQMDSWLTLFNEQLRPLLREHDIRVEGTWVNNERTQFIWVRSFASEDVIAQKESEYYGSPERKALGDLPGTHIAKTEVRLIEPVLTAAPVT